MATLPTVEAADAYHEPRLNTVWEELTYEKKEAALALGFTPPVLDADDFSLALRWLATHVHKTYTLTVEVEARDPVVIGDREVRVLLTELVRELLFNVVKHARVDHRSYVRSVGGRK